MINCKHCNQTKNCWFAGEDHEREECRQYIPTTNAERIRRMSDDELACFLADAYALGAVQEKCSARAWKRWLTEEVKA